jgi:hypothetical protein
VSTEIKQNKNIEFDGKWNLIGFVAKEGFRGETLSHAPISEQKHFFDDD